jgi:hypothetical protein
MVTQYKNLIGGKMVGTDRWLDVVNPANEQVIGQVPACGKAELDEAVAAARAAFKTWKNTPIEERRAAIMAISGAIKENAEELYRLLTSEQGKPHDQARGEIYGAAGMSAAQSTLSLDDEINEDSDARLSRTRRVPVGVVAGIVPRRGRDAAIRRLLDDAPAVQEGVAAAGDGGAAVVDGGGFDELDECSSHADGVVGVDVGDEDRQ